jgi:hypothetical protein
LRDTRQVTPQTVGGYSPYTPTKVVEQLLRQRLGIGSQRDIRERALRLGRYEPAAIIAGFALSPLSAAAIPELGTAIAHLREVLGDQTNESLARKGEVMTTGAIATYAYDQIDQARAELERHS